MHACTQSHARTRSHTDTHIHTHTHKTTGHLLSVANMALHPTKPILVTASDDKTWKMWHMPAGDLIMCGEGHKVCYTFSCKIDYINLVPPLVM